MTKEQYEAAVITLQAKYKCDSDYYQGLVDVNSEYIASLEAENARLNRALDVLCNKLEQLACPPNANPHDGQPCNDSDDCVNCWREYALAEAEEEI